MVSFRSSDAFVARWKQRQTMTKLRVLGCCGNFHGPAFASAVVGWFSCMTMQQACATSIKVFPLVVFRPVVLLAKTWRAKRTYVCKMSVSLDGEWVCDANESRHSDGSDRDARA